MKLRSRMCSINRYQIIRLTRVIVNYPKMSLALYCR